jgi:uncharacterized ion transporter superfamily protein YfcC
LIFAILSWVVPPGTYDYETVDINGTMRNIAIDGTFHYVDKSEATPTSFLGFFASFYEGCVSAADIIFVILSCGGTFSVLVKTGAFHAGIGALLKKFRGKEVILVPILMSVFAIGGSCFGMLSEFYGFIPLIIGLGVAMGYDAMFGFAIIILGEYVGFMGATLNPYTVAVAQSIAGVPLYSGTGFRVICLVAFIIVCCIYVLRYGKKIKNNPELSIVHGDQNPHAFDRDSLDEFVFDKKAALIVLDVIVVLVFLALGMTQWGWGYGELCGLFYIMSIVAAIISGWTADEYVDNLIAGAKTVFWGAILTGMAKGIVVVMEAALIKDTLIYGLANLLSGVPSFFSAQVMLIVQSLLNFPISSGSGQAAATMPIMAPLADLLGISRQTACIAFQFGDGLSNLIWPTCGCVIVCGIGGIPLQKWWKWFLPLAAILFVMQMIFVGIACVVFPA